MNNNFSLQIAQSLVESQEQFPIDFDLAWQWLEYSRKDVAKRSFENGDFVENFDYCSFRRNVKREIGATVKEDIFLTIDCFKTWAMLSRTEKGKQVRLYFLECEKIAKQSTSTAVTESKALPTAVEYANALIGLESLQDSLLKQLIKDSMIDELELQRNCKMLSDKNSKLSYTTVKVRAKQLGFSERDIKNGAELGKYVKKRINPVLQEMIGRYPTYHYEINNELDHAIINFFRSQNIFPSK